MTVTLPWPPPLNRLYRVVNGRPILSRQARTYRQVAGMRCFAAGLKLPALHDVNVSLWLYRPRRTGDVDGPIKLLLDCLQGFAFKNDKQVCDLHVYRRDDKANPRVEVEVVPVSPIREAFAALHNAGGKAWDDVADPAAFLGRTEETTDAR